MQLYMSDVCSPIVVHYGTKILAIQITFFSPNNQLKLFTCLHVKTRYF